VEQNLLSHATIAPAVVDPLLIEKLTEILLEKSPLTLPTHSTHPRKKILTAEASLRHKKANGK